MTEITECQSWSQADKKFKVILDFIHNSRPVEDERERERVNAREREEKEREIIGY